ncbi:hypothetical protein NDA13_003053 [Ustilago tritici]|nr:hypothetical protein NDA13_003053 [Ustilago tritici]
MPTPPPIQSIDLPHLTTTQAISSRPTRDAERIAAERIAAEAATQQAATAAAASSPSDVTAAQGGIDELAALDREMAKIITGKNIWAARRPNPSSVTNGGISPPLVPFEDLPFPRSDRAKLSSCTIRWQFTDRFSLNREEAAARGSLVAQVRRWLELKFAQTGTFSSSFLAEWAVDVLSTSRLRLLAWQSSPKPPWFSMAHAFNVTSWDLLHDVWLEISRIGDDPSPLATGKVFALVETSPNAEGGRDLDKVTSIPGWIKIDTRECPVEYPSCLEWCTTCKSNASLLHAFDNCPRRRCFHCDKSGHSAAFCPEAANAQDDDSAMDRQQAIENARGADVRRYRAYRLVNTGNPIWLGHIGQEEASRMEAPGKERVISVASRTTSTMAPLRLASLFTVSTWNRASLNQQERIATLHDPSTPLGKSDVVFLQEMRLASPTAVHDYATYAKVRIPETKPAVGSNILSVSLAFSAPRTDLGPGVWRLNREAHLQPGFARRMSEYASQLSDNVSHPPIQRWFTFVERIRTASSNISTSLSQQLQKKKAKRTKLVQELNILDIRHGDDTRQRFLILLEHLRQLEIAQASTTLDLRRSMHEANMFRPTSWIIPRLESRSFAALPNLRDESGIHTTLQGKLDAIERFCRSLYTPQPSDRSTEEASAILLTAVKNTIEPSTRHALESPFTVDEFQRVLRRAPALSAPGMDGLPYPLLEVIGDVALDRLCVLGNALMQGHQLPNGEPVLRGVLPKEGVLSQLSNYRPLSIATAALRLLGGAVSNRLQSAASDTLHSAQTGFIVVRSSAINVITLYLLQRAVATSLVPGPIWILNLDQQKAYDRVRRTWLLDCLIAYGFGPRFLTYIREIYRHPTVRQSAEGHFTEPIPLECGLLQGDPMSCLLYNFSLQPLLDYARNHHHAETTLTWDPGQPLHVSSLAFADDILLIVNNQRDIDKFMDSLELYELASNAKVNEDKSHAFAFGPAAGDSEGLTVNDIPFPTIGESNAEVIHLGYPVRLDGGVPSVTIEKRLSSVQAKINVLATTATTLLARMQICNSFLLSKLWHTIRLCPLPSNFQRMVNTTINPFLFLGRRNWLRHEYAVAPRPLGGLGVINANHMAIALLGQIIAKLLASEEQTGAQFRAALQDLMWTKYKTMPAHLLLRRGLPWLHMNSVVTAQKSFLHRCVYTLCQLRLSITPTWDNISVPELLSLPFHNDMFGYKWPPIEATTTGRWEHNGLRVWGDALWYNPNQKGKVPHPVSVVKAYPLVPPAPSGVKNYVPSRGKPDTYHAFGEAAGRLLSNYWKDIWDHLHPTVASKLLDISKHFRIHPDHSKSSKNSRPHDRPFDIDTVGLPFPWRLATLADKPIAAYTVKHARAFKANDKVITPDWQFEADASHWKQAREWHLKNNVLTSAAQPDVFLFLHRRPWLVQKPRLQRQRDNNETLFDDNIATRLDFFAHPTAEDDPDAAIDRQLPDFYEIEHVFGVAACILCNGPKDSAAHGFIECEQAQRVWKTIMPTLRKLVNGRSVPLNTRSVPNKRIDFVKRWIDRGVFLKERQGTLVFHTMTGPAGAIQIWLAVTPVSQQALLNENTQQTSAHPNAPRTNSIDTSAGFKVSKCHLASIHPSATGSNSTSQLLTSLNDDTQQTSAHPNASRTDRIGTSAGSKVSNTTFARTRLNETTTFASFATLATLGSSA